MKIIDKTRQIQSGSFVHSTPTTAYGVWSPGDGIEPKSRYPINQSQQNIPNLEVQNMPNDNIVAIYSCPMSEDQTYQNPLILNPNWPYISAEVVPMTISALQEAGRLYREAKLFKENLEKTYADALEKAHEASRLVGQLGNEVYEANKAFEAAGRHLIEVAGE